MTVWPIIAYIPDPEQNDAPERLPRAEGCAGGWETGFSETNPAGIPQRIGPPLSASVYEPLNQHSAVSQDLERLAIRRRVGTTRLESLC